MSPDTPLIYKSHAQDIDEQSEMLSGWEQEYRQLSCGKFSGSVSTAHTRHISVVCETTNQSLHERVAAPPGQLVFGLVLNSEHPLHMNGREVHANSLLIVEGGREYDLRTTGNTELVGIVLERDFFYRQIDEQNTCIADDAIAQKVLRLEPAAASMLRQFWLMLSQILQRTEDSWPSNMPLHLLADTAFNNIWIALNMSQEQPAGADVPRSSERQARIVQQAIRYMRSHLDDEICIADVCAATHVSQRTLQYHFEHCLQISPQQYLKALRLNAARRMFRRLLEVRGNNRQHTVADVAAACGYDHPSRFAADYKRQFGQLPSEAMRKVIQDTDRTELLRVG